ncbi:MAG: thioredoxin family protein [Planctomycetaceae bacterium]|nr:thioredoxin family protein [Planctomycetaceae bacterium]
MFAVLSSVGFAQQQQPVRWEATLEAAQRLAGQTNRLVLVQFEASWCGNCRRMEAEVLNQPSVAAELAADYVPVRINADHFPSTANQYGVRFLPTTVIVTPQGQVVDSMRGYIGAPDFTARLNRVALTAKQRGAMYAQLPTGGAPNLSTAPASNVPAAPTSPLTAASPTSNVSGPALVGSPSSVPASAKNSPTAATTGLSDDRYADYFRQSPSQTTTTVPPIASPASSASPNPVATQPAAPTTPNPVSAATSLYPQPAAAPTLTQPSVPAVTASLYGSQSTSVATQPTQPQSAIAPSQASRPSPQLPTMNPPLALDGFCPVALMDKQQWVMGDRRWGAVHRGRTYLFRGPEEQKQFFSDPDRYAPVLSGNDVVLASEQSQTVPGRREHGAYFGNRIYLFASEATLDKFTRNPNLYANQATAAMRATGYAGQPLK